jgi:hypothetical protein
MMLTFTNLNAAFYDVYVYGAMYNGTSPSTNNGADLAINIGGATNYWEEPNGPVNMGSFYYMPASSTDPTNFAQGDFVVFTSVTPVNGAITITVTPEDTTYTTEANGVGIAGLQLFSSASLALSGPPLTVVRQGNQVLISWPNGLTPFQLQSAGVLNGAWTKVTTPPALSLNGSTYSVSLPVTGAAAFYRLSSSLQ